MKAGLWYALDRQASCTCCRATRTLILSASFDPTSRWIVTGGKDGTLRSPGAARSAAA